MMLLLKLIFSLLTLLPVCRSQDNYSSYLQTAEQNANVSACRVQPLYRVTPADYDSGMPPFVKGQSLPVYISLWIVSITEINEMRQDFTVDLYFRMWWSDFRILYPVCEDRGFIIIDHAQLKVLWFPDVFFATEKKAARHHVLKRNGGLRLHKKKHWLFYSERLTVTNFCAFDFRYFPMDRQRCPMPMEPYIFHSAFVNLSFGDPGIYFNNFKFKIPQYTLNAVDAEDCSYSYHLYGQPLNQTCAQAIFVLDRQFSYYFVQMYLPSILIVLVSFLSFWIPVENVPGRVALGVTSLLTLATQFTTMQRSLPPVSYMKAMDVWMFFCIVVVFLSMVEFTLAFNFKIALVEPDDKAESPPAPPTKQTPARSPMPPVVDLEPVDPYSRRQPRVIVLEEAGGKLSYLRNLLVRIVKLAKQREGSVIDNASKIMFPVVFMLFNVTYWLYYLRRKHQHAL